MAKSLASGMQAHSQGWSRAFYRLEVSDVAHSSSGSFVTSAGVQVMDAFAFDSLFEELERFGQKLTARVKPADRSFCILLLSINSDFDYNIDFDWLDLDRWRISKMDGGTGIPEGK